MVIWIVIWMVISFHCFFTRKSEDGYWMVWMVIWMVMGWLLDGYLDCEWMVFWIVMWMVSGWCLDGFLNG